MIYYYDEKFPVPPLKVALTIVNNIKQDTDPHA